MSQGARADSAGHAELLSRCDATRFGTRSGACVTRLWTLLLTFEPISAKMASSSSKGKAQARNNAAELPYELPW